VWVIFGYSIIVAAVASWAAASIALVQPETSGTTPRAEYGALGLIVSLIPASILLLGALSLFMLKKWAIWLFGMNALIVAWSLYLTPSSNGLFWLVIALATCLYTIYLRHRGALS